MYDIIMVKEAILEIVLSDNFENYKLKNI